MACFLVPMGEAIVTTLVQKAVEIDERRTGARRPATGGLTRSRRLGWLNKLLWGGTALLAFEHVWHGEVVPWPPFLTAMENPADVAPMLHEVATIGTGMAIFVTVVWLVIVAIAERRAGAVPEPRRDAVGGGR